MNDSELLLTRMEDLAVRADRMGMAHSKFLTIRESAQVAQCFQNRKDVKLIWDGGFSGAERQIAVFLQPDWGDYEPEEVLAGLSFTYREQDSLRHQDILGSVLGLGLEREMLGDISVSSGKAFLCCFASVADYVSEQLTKAGRVGVTLRRIAVSDLPDLTVELRLREVTVASLRLDAFVAAAFNCSRSEAAGLVTSGFVQLCHQECLVISKTVEQGDIVSVRGKGRVKLVGIHAQSRKGRQWVELGYYS